MRWSAGRSPHRGTRPDRLTAARPARRRTRAVRGDAAVVARHDGRAGGRRCPRRGRSSNVVDADGYAAFAQSAATDPGLQQAMASELTTQMVTLAANSGYDVRPTWCAERRRRTPGAPAFPASSPPANRIAHRWMFTDTASSDRIRGPLGDRPRADAGRQFVPADVAGLRHQGADQPAGPVDRERACGVAARTAAARGHVGSVGQRRRGLARRCVRAADHCAARGRGKAIAALGVSGLLVGAAGWAGLEVGRRYVSNALGAPRATSARSPIRWSVTRYQHAPVAECHAGRRWGTGGGRSRFALLGGIGRRSVREPAPISEPRS